MTLDADLITDLKGSVELIRSRVDKRHGHFMPSSLLQSQFDALEEPAADEHAIIVDVAPAPAEIARNIHRELDARFGPARRSA